jgi:hypothetical protein
VGEDFSFDRPPPPASPMGPYPAPTAAPASVPAPSLGVISPLSSPYPSASHGLGMVPEAGPRGAGSRPGSPYPAAAGPPPPPALSAAGGSADADRATPWTPSVAAARGPSPVGNGHGFGDGGSSRRLLRVPVPSTVVTTTLPSRPTSTRGAHGAHGVLGSTLGDATPTVDPYGPTVRAAVAGAEDAVMVVDVHVSAAVFDLLPPELTSSLVHVVPVLFTQVCCGVGTVCGGGWGGLGDWGGRWGGACCRNLGLTSVAAGNGR